MSLACRFGGVLINFEISAFWYTPEFYHFISCSCIIAAIYFCVQSHHYAP